MREMFAYILITGKTIEESRLSLIIRWRCARIGILKTLLLLIKMVVAWSTDVLLVTVGRNKNFIQITLN